jgi:hypothetical protein
MTSDDLASRREVVKLYRGFAAQDPSQRSELAAALQDLAGEAQGNGLLAEALASIREAKQIYQDLIREGHADQIQLAGCLNHEANWLAEAADPQAERVFADEGAVYMSLARNVAADQLLGLVSVLQPILDLNMSVGRYRSAENVARACIEVARRAAEQDPQAEAYLASSYTSLAASLRQQGRLSEALAEASRSAQIARQVAARNVPGFDKTVLITALALVEEVATAFGRPDEARAAQLELRAQRSGPA